MVPPVSFLSRSCRGVAPTRASVELFPVESRLGGRYVNRWVKHLVVVLVVAGAICAPESARAQATGGAAAYTPPKTTFGHPDLQGIWQVMNTAAHNVEPHTAMLGVPAGLGVIVDPPDGMIPYRPEALAKRQENFKNRASLDPLNKCYKPGVPRLTYLPFPFQIFQTPQLVTIVYEFIHNYRTAFLNRDKHLEGLEGTFWNGDSIG